MLYIINQSVSEKTAMKRGPVEHYAQVSTQLPIPAIIETNRFDNSMID